MALKRRPELRAKVVAQTAAIDTRGPGDEHPQPLAEDRLREFLRRSLQQAKLARRERLRRR
ncbi:MAG TPA: hypothetical protein VIC84_22765, partial [Blastocatellia bacterium]